MKQMLSERTAAVMVALSARPSGLRLAEIAGLTGAPLSTVQTTIKGLLEEGLAVAVGDSRPAYRLAPEAPAGALRQIAEWRLTPERSALIAQQAAAMAGDQDLPRFDLREQLARAMADTATARAMTEMAGRLIWWQPAARTLRRPARLIAQAMAIGTTQDIEAVESVFGKEALRAVLAVAPPGVFDPRRWNYWHLHFGYRRTPPQPARRA